MDTRIISFMDLNSHYGGGQVALCNNASALAELGHEVHIFLGLKKIPERISKICEDRCNIYLIPGYDNIFDINLIRSRIQKLLCFYDDKFHIDVLNVQGLNALLIQRSLYEKMILTLHGNNFKRGLCILNAFIHNRDVYRSSMKSYKTFMNDFFGHFLYGIQERKSCKISKLVIALTPMEKNYAMKYYAINEDKIKVIPNVITDPYDVSDLDFLDIPEDKKVILNVGSQNFVKGIPFLVKILEDIFKIHDDVVFVGVGNGPLHYLVHNFCRRYPSRTYLFKELSNELFSVYARSDIYLHTSMFEAFGLSIGEAMFAGNPVVAFNTTSIPYLVRDKYNGLLAAPLNVEDMLKKTSMLLNNENIRKEMGINAKNYIRNFYSKEVVGKRFELIIKEF